MAQHLLPILRYQKMPFFVRFFIVLLGLLSSLLSANTWQVSKQDAGNTLFIGDIHADADSLHFVLERSGAIDRDGNLTDKFDDVVFVGDYLGKGKNNLEVLDTLMDLEDQSQTRGHPRMHFLLGNHELRMVTGDYKYISDQDQRKLIAEGLGSVQDAFGNEGRYGQWLAHKQAMVQIGSDLVSHAGFSLNELEHDPGQINQMVREWMAYLMDAGPQPPEDTAWVVGLKKITKRKFDSIGPIWTHAMAPGKKKRRRSSDGQLTLEQAREYLQRLGAERIILGHNPAKNSRIQLSHEVFGNLVILIDSGISAAVGGKPSALMRINGELVAQEWDRPAKPQNWITRLRRKFRAPLSSHQPPLNPCAREMTHLDPAKR